MSNKVISDDVVYKFVGETIRRGFGSIDEALKYIDGKLPANGKDWTIEEIHTKVIQHKIESKRKVIDNKEITKKIIDYFIKHATINNVNFDSNEQFFINPEHRDFRYHDQLYSFLCAEKYLGYNKEQYWELYNEINKKFEKNNYTYFGNVCKAIVYIALSNKYGLTKEDILKINFDDYTELKTFEEKYPKMSKECYHLMHDLYMADGDGFRPGEYGDIMEKPNIWRYVKGQELLDYYIEELKKIPIDDFEWERNVGDYKPCHNYKLKVKKDNIPDEQRSIHMYTWGLPGIMFRDNDIYVTNSNYIGRHVHHKNTLSVDVDENLYNYCIKNLNK